MKVRKARKSDLPELVAMAKDFVDYHGTLGDEYANDVTRRKTTVKRSFRKWFEKHVKKPSSLLLVAENSQGLAGFCLAVPDEFPPMFTGKKNIFGKICEIFVKKEFRRSGVGKKMINEAEKFFKEKGLLYSSMFVTSANQTAINAYKKYGYREYLKEMMKRLG